MADDSLAQYRAKRNFTKTQEPAEGGVANADAPVFVIQKHWATRLHYDLRLELDGVMKSWAVPKGPSFDPKDKRMAVEVEDHPISYNQFEGEIPKGEYGAGKVIIWDEGRWAPLGDPRAGYRDGMLKFEMSGVKMHGRWALIRMKPRGDEDAKKPAWLLIKEKDQFVRPTDSFSVVDEMPDSVVPLRKSRRPKAASKKAVSPDKAGSGAAATTKLKPKAASKMPSRSATASPSETETVPRSRRKTDALSSVSAQTTLPGEDAPLPATLKPQLATLVDTVPPDSDAWVFEIKFDGYRMLARIEETQVQLFTRNGHDWTHKLPHIAAALSKLALPSGWLDGEIVVPGENGAPSFQALQNAFDASKTAGIVYYLFDAPFLAGRDLRREPLDVRRKLLKQLLDRSDDKGNAPGNLLRFSEDFDVQPKDLIASACRMGLEGVIGKRRASPYVMRRADSWIKLKCTQRQEFVIAGYTSPKGGRAGFGSLLLGVHGDDGELRYAGNVGTGFDQTTLIDIKKRLDELLTQQRPFTKATALDRTAHWVKPLLLAEVSFSEWTSAGSVRHAVFHGLREDKPAKAITRERARSAQTLPTDGPMRASPKTVAVDETPGRTAKKAAISKAQPATQPSSRSPAPTKASRKAKAMETEPGDQLRVTHGDRVIDPSTGVTKLQLVRFYLLIAPLMVAHLKQRPVSLVRAPGGITGQLFFQKHLEASIPGVKALDPALDPGHASLLEVPSPKAIVSAAQMNVVEFHTWNAVKTAIGKPDRMTFDLDPGEGVSWHRIQQAAQLVRAFLSQLGLSAFLKTSGGKGLHVVVPVKKHFDWDTVKGFSQAVVQHLAKTLPDHFVAKSGPKNRVGKIFVDYLRNGFGATTVSAWSARARPGLGVSVPVGWDEIEALTGGAHWHIANIHERLDAGNAPWTDYAAQSVVPAMKALGYTPPDR